MARDALADIRASVFARADSDPSGTTKAVDACNLFINQALQQLALDAPFLFWDEQVRLATQTDYVPTDAEDTVTLAADPSGTRNEWVLRTSRPISYNVANWQINGGWDGRMIDIYDSDGRTHTFRIRTVWFEELYDPPGPNGADDYYMMSLWSPVPYDTIGDGPFEYKVYTPDYYFPDDTIEIRSLRVVNTTLAIDPIKVISQNDAERAGIVDAHTNVAAGVPRYAYRRGNFSLTAPNVAPVATLGNVQISTERWVGPEPPGRFEYCFTYYWGIRYLDHAYPTPPVRGANTAWAAYTQGPSGAVTGRNRVPKWESSPSPISSAITTTGPSPTYGSAAVLSLPNIDYMQGFFHEGFFDGGTGSAARELLGKTRSGWNIRIYRRRITEDFTNYEDLGVTVPGASVTGLAKLDIHDGFVLLDDVPADLLVDAGFTYIDNGTILPDYHVRLRNIHGYQAFRLFPQPDDLYELEARVLRRPARLVSESDAPSIRPEAIDLLIEGALARWYERAKEPVSAAGARDRYEKLLRTARSRYGDMRPQNEPVSRLPARVRRRRSTDRSRLV